MFGDLRTPNIMVMAETIKLIDFDWAGRAGQVTYPLALSSGIPWPDSVAGGALITKEHDFCMISALQQSSTIND